MHEYKENPPPCLSRVRVMGHRNYFLTLSSGSLFLGTPPLLIASTGPPRIDREPQKELIHTLLKI